jgi:hypothetical protein
MPEEPVEATNEPTVDLTPDPPRAPLGIIGQESSMDLFWLRLGAAAIIIGVVIAAWYVDWAIMHVGDEYHATHR